MRKEFADTQLYLQGVRVAWQGSGRRGATTFSCPGCGLHKSRNATDMGEDASRVFGWGSIVALAPPTCSPLRVEPPLSPFAQPYPDPLCAPLPSTGFLLKNSQGNKPEKNSSDRQLERKEDGASARDCAPSNPAFSPVSAAYYLFAFELIIFLGRGLPAHRGA